MTPALWTPIHEISPSERKETPILIQYGGAKGLNMPKIHINDLTFCRKCPHSAYGCGVVCCAKSFNPMCIIAGKVVDGFTLYNQRTKQKGNYRKGRYQIGRMEYHDFFTGERHYKFYPDKVEAPLECPYRLEMVLNANTKKS